MLLLTSFNFCVSVFYFRFFFRVESRVTNKELPPTYSAQCCLQEEHMWTILHDISSSQNHEFYFNHFLQMCWKINEWMTNILELFFFVVLKDLLILIVLYVEEVFIWWLVTDQSPWMQEPILTVQYFRNEM